MKFLLDTNAVSEPLRPTPDRAFTHWLQGQDPEVVATSVVVLGEVKRGILLLPLGRRRMGLEHWFAEWLVDYGDRILPVDVRAAAAWAEVSAKLRRRGRPTAIADELIAATALVHNLAVVTRNRRDFEASGCEVISPWTERSA